MSLGSWAKIGVSAASKRTSNPIRAIVDMIKPDPKHAKSFIALSIGDPCVDGNLLPPETTTNAICAAVKSAKYNGYGPTFGLPDARAAVSEYMNSRFHKPSSAITADDVIITGGCSHAIFLALGSLCDPGDNVLVPKPGFSIYDVLSNYLNVETKAYSCIPEKGWEVDLSGVRSLVTPKTKAILVNNPSNPCGSNFSEEHLHDIVSVAEELKVPIISDEIYAGMTFPGEKPFVPIANISTKVPCIVVGGLAKNFICPGYRVGWVYRHDPTPNKEALADVFPAMTRLSQTHLGPSTIVQAALRSTLLETPAEYTQHLLSTLSENASHCYNRLMAAEGLTPVRPTAAMYMMVRVDFDRFDPAHGIMDDVSFSKRLMEEENVQVLPGTIFKAPGFFRVVTTRPKEVLDEAMNRIVSFTQNCQKK